MKGMDYRDQTTGQGEYSSLVYTTIWLPAVLHAPHTLEDLVRSTVDLNSHELIFDKLCTNATEVGLTVGGS